MGQGKLGEVILRGTRAAQPVATTVADGTWYYVTDESKTERSNGSAWQDCSDGGSTGITALTGDVTATGPGSSAATIANNAVTTVKILDANVTRAKLSNGTALSVIGRSANSAGVPADISASAASGAVLRESGSTLGFGTVATAGIADAAVTYAKIQDVSAISKLLGRGAAAGAGDVEEITLGTGLTMTATTLSAGAGSGGASYWMGAGVAATGFNPGDAQTLRFGVQPNINPATADPGFTPNVIRTGTVSRVYGDFLVFGTLGSAQNVTVRVRNITANTNQDVTTTLQMTAASNPFNNTTMTLAVTAGDRICIEFVTPTWTTNPLSCIFNATVEISY